MADPSGGEPARPPRLRRRALGPAGLAALATYVLLALFLTHGVWQEPRPALVGENMDAVQAAWFVGWVAFAVAHLHDPLITTYISPPGHPVGLMWNNAAPLMGLILSPITLARGAFVAFDVGIAGGLALSAWTAFLVISGYSRRATPAWVGGLVFGFSPWAVSEASGGHLFLVNCWLIPIFFVLLLRLVTGSAEWHRWQGVALGLVGAGELLISQELFADMVLLGGVMVVVSAVAARHPLGARFRRVAPGLAVAAAAFAVIAAVPVAVALLGPGHGLHGRLQDPWTDVADLIAFVVPRGTQLLSPFGAAAVAARDGGYFEGALYPGIPLLAIVALAWWRCRSDPIVRGAVLLFVAAGVLALGPALRVDGIATPLPLPWRALLAVPVYGLLMPARMGPFVFLGAAVSLAVVVDRLWPEHTRLRVGRPAMVMVAAVLPLVPAGPLPVWLFANPTFFTGAAVRAIPAGGLAVVGPAPILRMAPLVWDFDPMLWQLESGFRFRIPWGFAIQPGTGGRAAGAAPAGVLERAWLRGASATPGTVGRSGVARIRAELRRWDVRAVVVGPMPHRGWAVSVVTTVLGRSPRWTGGVAVWNLGGHASAVGRVIRR